MSMSEKMEIKSGTVVKKDSRPYYFPHDSNARNNDKLIAVRMRLGAEGYGIYFMILERLMDCTEYMSAKDYNIIAFDLRVSAENVKSIVEDFGLFSFTDDGELFYSEELINRMAPLNNAIEQRRIAGQKSAEKRAQRQQKATVVEQPLNDRLTTVERELEKTPTKKAISLEKKPTTVERQLPKNPTDKNIYNINNNINTKETLPNGRVKKDELSLSHPSVKNDPIDYDGLQETFNTMFADKLPMVQSLSPKRRAAVRARASEHGKSAIMDVFKKVQESNFLLGHNDRNWHCDFDWIFKPTSFIRILEGNYDGKSDNEIQGAGTYTPRKTATDKEASRAALDQLADAILGQHQP